MKQTAVEWLIEKIQQANPTFKFDALIREGIKMEKEQIIDFAKKFSDFNGLTFNEKEVTKEHLEKLFDELTFKSE